MSIAPETLLDSKQRVVRVIGRELLAKVREKAEDLGVEGELDAVHDFRVALRRLRSWLRAFDEELAPTVRPKIHRRLKRIADATRTSRDCEVHIAWLEHFGTSQRGKYQQATEWLVDDLRSQKADADLELRKAVDKHLDRTSARLSEGLSQYIVNLDEPDDSMAARLSTLIRDHAVAAANCIPRIASVGDRAEAHEARIAVKRVRYLIEPLGETTAGADSLVDDLSKLQDDLGALHDAQIFGSEIARRLAKVLAASAPADFAGEAERARDAAVSVSARADALRAISQRLHREELRAFKLLGANWLTGGTDDLWVRADSIASALERARPT